MGVQLPKLPNGLFISSHNYPLQGEKVKLRQQGLAASLGLSGAEQFINNHFSNDTDKIVIRCQETESPKNASILSVNIQIIRQKIGQEELEKLAREIYGELVKGVVDVERKILALGGEYHIDSNEILIADGSNQSQVWGINIYLNKNKGSRIEYHSLINIRPAAGNPTAILEDKKLQEKIRTIVDTLVE